VTDRQERLLKFSQDKLAKATVLLIGAGGLGGEIGEGLVRKGAGALKIFDDDIVELSNLNRQRFYRRDLFKSKALRLTRNLAQEGVMGTRLQGYALSLQDAVVQGIDLAADAVVVGVDNNPTRVFAARHFRALGTPVVFTAVSRTANNGYVFVQESNGPCFGCLFPDAVIDETYPCPGTPAIKDILKVVAGLVLYALDSILMARPRQWQYKDIVLDGSIPGNDWRIATREDCLLCASVRQDTEVG
jgi:molybdopterin/thiamine biosynthesis adenylyltransferase